MLSWKSAFMPFKKVPMGKLRTQLMCFSRKFLCFEVLLLRQDGEIIAHCPLQVIAAEGEHKASSALKEAAHVIQVSQHFNTLPSVPVSICGKTKVHILKYFTPDSQIRHSSPIMSPTASNMKIPPTLSSSNLVLLAWILILSSPIIDLLLS